MPQTRLLAFAAVGLISLAGAFVLGLRTGHAQTSNRVFEIRTYTCNPGRLPALEARFRDHTVTIFNRHGMTSIGYWVPQDAPRSQDTLIYILAHPSREAAKQHWDEFQNDPEWKTVRDDSEASGKIVNHVDSVFADPTDFSPIK
jgi:hypothetical protein